MGFEKPLPQWNAAGAEPPSSLRNEGWKVRQRPPADYWNWFMSRTYLALLELQQDAIHKDNLKDATTTVKGIVQLSSSTTSSSELLAATSKSVKAAYDLANGKESPAGVITKIEQTSFKKFKSSKDANGIFTTIEYRRKLDNTLAVRAVLSGGTSPKYTTRTITYYAANGTTVAKTEVFMLSYDADGVLMSEV
ncbi:phage tail protein [Domibacillus aminovorans]|uniref:phage tail protein n=1 Tax=Domibacillus aminovorans TaxID=29332 RepID=UPI0007C7C8A5|nr:phage tail protein [Domibacillus aminovorans]